jgi:hypothetical protein
MKQEAVGPLTEMWKSDTNRRMAARAFWVLLKAGTNPSVYINEAAASTDPDTRIMAIRAAKEYNIELVPLLQKLSADTEPQGLT